MKSSLLFTMVAPILALGGCSVQPQSSGQMGPMKCACCEMMSAAQTGGDAKKDMSSGMGMPMMMKDDHKGSSPSTAPSTLPGGESTDHSTHRGG